MTIVNSVVLVAGLLALMAASMRWLRVAQREHYLPGSALRFALRWWHCTPIDTVCVSVGVAGAVASWFLAPLAIVSLAVAGFCPLRLGLRGSTSRLSWTRRLTTLGVVVGVLGGACLGAGSLIGGLGGGIVALAFASIACPVLVDVALAITRPIESQLSEKFVRRAVARLERVKPIVVAVTGSYGKTTTKGYIAHLVGADRQTLASPASFNNKNGLARTVNEFLGPATEVLVAEMGTYGPGEIAAMCEWMPPAIAVITAIGPAHLERFKSLDLTLEAKSEIAAKANVVVLNADDELLSTLSGRLQSEGKRVVRASGEDPTADVAVLPVPDGIELRIAGKRKGVAVMSAAARPTALSNAACAVGVALELGLPVEGLLRRLASLPLPPNRLQRYVTENGCVVLDDTFNSNPAGARLALERLGAETGTKRRVLVTPGMVELGRSQFSENAAFAEAAAASVSDILVVRRTNLKALIAGASRGAEAVNVVAFDRLDQAVDWVKAELGEGDAVLYENDLPDHFP